MTSFLAIYLNDHLAGSTGGVELARRLRSSNRNDAVFGPPLAEICAEIEADRKALQDLMEQLEITPSRLKPVGAWVGEKLGRLKLNGRARGYSPLSRLIELELLFIGITGKMRLWRALEHSLGQSQGELDFALLAERAADQRNRVGELHLKAAAPALRSAATSASS